MTDVTILRSRLESAEQAYHDLVTGGAAKVFVDQNGERVEYVAANAARLSSYIELLRRKIAEASGHGSGWGPLCPMF